MWPLEFSLYIPYVFHFAPLHFLAILGSPPGQANSRYLSLFPSGCKVPHARRGRGDVLIGLTKLNKQVGTMPRRLGPKRRY